jgi:hypothetical protein
MKIRISDSAFSIVKLAVESSGIERAVIGLSEYLESDPLPDEVLRLPEFDRDHELEKYRASGGKINKHLIACVYSRSDVPDNCVLNVQGIDFSFSPEWQELMDNWLLDLSSDSLVLLDKNKKVLLPS